MAWGDVPIWHSISDRILLGITIASCEGGWTHNEVEGAIAHGFQPVSLGKRILRAITALIGVSSLVAAYLEQSDRKENSPDGNKLSIDTIYLLTISNV